jgi:tRNA-2-methylthio-N6-dimethylallyladenosine synthase
VATECINGFPTETKEEFQSTLDFIKEVGFDWGFIFPFSARRGSESEKIEPKVPEEEILVRMKYARDYLKKIGYNSSTFKKHNILAFSKDSFDVKLDEGVKSFCFSTID